MSFISLDDFHKRVLHPGESLSVYSRTEKTVKSSNMPDISAQTMEQLLLHQLLMGLPIEVSKQLRATGATDTLKTVVERAKILMTVEQYAPAKPCCHCSTKTYH